MIYKCLKFIISLFLKIVYCPIGVKSLPRGGAVLAPNHKSNLDPILVGAITPGFVNFLAKDSLFKNKIFAKIISFAGAIPLKRGKSDKGALEAAIEKLRQGRRVVVFPQGHRQKTIDPKGGKAGAAMIAYKACKPIIPIKISGRQIIYGKPITPTDDYEKTTREVMEAIIAL
jgi:1-acyl-sn-glycerol-3-phosphate acyltransferase